MLCEQKGNNIVYKNIIFSFNHKFIYSHLKVENSGKEK